MQLFNNTQQDVNWNVDYQGGGDCGSLGSGGSVDQPNWDSNPSLNIDFFGVPSGGHPTPISVTISKTNPGATVTIGLYYE